MKWENRDLNLVEWANISKFSKLDDIVTPLRLLKLFFDEVLADMIVGYIKLYTHRKKADIRFEITNEKTRLFFTMLLLSGSHKLPDRKMYWEATPDTFVLARSDSVLRNTFERILRNLYLFHYEQLDK